MLLSSSPFYHVVYCHEIYVYCKLLYTCFKVWFNLNFFLGGSYVCIKQTTQKGGRSEKLEQILLAWNYFILKEINPLLKLWRLFLLQSSFARMILIFYLTYTNTETNNPQFYFCFWKYKYWLSFVPLSLLFLTSLTWLFSPAAPLPWPQMYSSAEDTSHPREELLEMYSLRTSFCFFVRNNHLF